MSEKIKKKYEPISDDLEEIGNKIVHAAYLVHSKLGPGLLEKVYEECFCYELAKQGLNSARQLEIPISYDEIHFNAGLRLDVLVEDKVICELKSVESIIPVWEAQIISHLKLSKKRLGYLINFNVANIGHGIKRFVN